MRKLIVIVSLILVSNSSFCQIAKGSVIIGGSLGYTATNNSTDVNLSPYSSKADSIPVPNTTGKALSIGLNAGYFISDDLAAGLIFSYTNSKTPVNIEYNNSYYDWNNKHMGVQIGGYVEKFFTITGKFFITCSVTGYYAVYKDEDYYLYNSFSGVSEITSYPVINSAGYSFSIAPGLAFFPSSKWGITFKLNNIISYTTDTKMDVTLNFGSSPTNPITENNTTQTFTIGGGLVPTLGISYVFAPNESKKPRR